VTPRFPAAPRPPRQKAESVRSFEELREAEIRDVIVASADVQGRLFGRRVPIGVFSRMIDSGGGVDVSSCVLGWDISQSNELLLARRLEFTGMHTGIHDMRLRPDLTTLRVAGWLDHTAICMADIVDNTSGDLIPLAPRSLLRSSVDRVAQLGLSASVGTELEFYLFKGSPRQLRLRSFRDLEPTTLTNADYSLLESDEFGPFLDSVRTALLASDIEIESTQVEWGLGQWELNFAHGDPMAMADQHALYKLAMKSMAARAGLTATFMAKPEQDQPGCSCHIHLSFRDAEGAAVLYDRDADSHTTPIMRHAVGGILALANDLTPWYAPTINSYRRLNAQDAAGWGLTWGWDNRSVSVRVLARQENDTRLEFRLPGADTNPYLALAGLLTSAENGIRNSVDPGAPVVGNAYEQSVAALPKDLGSASRLFRQSKPLRELFGADVIEHYATLAEHEWRIFLDTVTEWDRTRYLDLI
jgi:glutamine synthetase